MKTLCAFTIGLGLALAASTAYATPDGTDPSVIINKTSASNSGGGGTDPTFETNSATNPIVINLVDGLADAQTYTFDPEETDPQNLDELFVQLNGALPGEVFFCGGDVFTGPCGTFTPDQNLDPEGTQAVGLVFTGGTITAQEQFTAEVTTPEPQSWIMLIASMLALLMLGMKYWEPNRSAQ